MFERFLVWMLRRVCPTTGGEAALFYAYIAVAAVGTGISVYNQIDANRRRQAVLEAELRSAELAALDEENQRLQALREANDMMLANAQGIEAWASPSLIAGREFNFRMTHQDIENTRFNLMTEKANIGAKIGMLQKNSRLAVAKGIFDIAQSVFGAMYTKSTLAKGGTEGQVLKTGSTDLKLSTKELVG